MIERSAEWNKALSVFLESGFSEEVDINLSFEPVQIDLEAIDVVTIIYALTEVDFPNKVAAPLFNELRDRFIQAYVMQMPDEKRE